MKNLTRKRRLCAFLFGVATWLSLQSLWVILSPQKDLSLVAFIVCTVAAELIVRAFFGFSTEAAVFGSELPEEKHH